MFWLKILRDWMNLNIRKECKYIFNIKKNTYIQVTFWNHQIFQIKPLNKCKIKFIKRSSHNHAGTLILYNFLLFFFNNLHSLQSYTILSLEVSPPFMTFTTIWWEEVAQHSKQIIWRGTLIWKNNNQVAAAGILDYNSRAITYYLMVKVMLCLNTWWQ